jgi:hypothetical protein
MAGTCLRSSSVRLLLSEVKGGPVDPAGEFERSIAAIRQLRDAGAGVNRPWSRSDGYGGSQRLSQAGSVVPLPLA